MAEKVEIRIEAVDAASATFNGMADRIQQLGKPVDELQAKAKKAGLALSNIKIDPKTGKVSYSASLDTSAAQAKAEALEKRGEFMRTMFANLSANLLASSLGLAVDFAGKLTTALSSAGKFQTQSIAAAQDIATNLNTPLDTAKEIVEKSQIEIAKIAASLPGETEDYSKVFNSLSGTLAENFRGNADGFSKAALDMTKRVTALASIRGANADDAGSAANKFLSGSATYGEMMGNDLFQKNPELQKALKNVAKEEGLSLDKWQTLTQQQRYKIFNRALTLAAPDTLFDAFQGTYESVTQGIQTALIDPQTGIFGVLRKVDLSTGIKSNVLDQAAASLLALTDLFGSLGKLGEKLGFSFDPMLALAETLSTFTGFVRGFDAALNSLLGGGDFDLGNAFGFDLDMIPQKISEFLGSILKWFENLDVDALGSALGKTWATWVNTTTKMFQNFDWFKFGQIVGTGLTKFGQLIVSFLFNAVTSLDWLGLITAILNIPLDLFKAFVGAMFGTVMTQARGMFDGALNFFKMLGDLFNKAVSMLPSLPSTPGQAVQAGVSTLNPIVGGVMGGLPGGLNPFDIVDKLMGKDKQPEKTAASTAEPIQSKPVGAEIKTISSLVEPIQQAPSGQTVAFAPNVQINAGQINDPEELGNIIMNRLSSEYANWSQQKLT